MSEYRSDRAWSDRYIPEIKRIVGPLLLEPAPFEIDATEATDLMVFTVKNFCVKDMRIAARIRRPGVREKHEKYGPEFTIRSRRIDCALPTEWPKILNGFGDWLFYGHAAAGVDPIIKDWMLICLHALRHHNEHYLPKDNKGAVDWDWPNPDRRTFFHAFRPHLFPANPPLVLATNIGELKAAA